VEDFRQTHLMALAVELLQAAIHRMSTSEKYLVAPGAAQLPDVTGATSLSAIGWPQAYFQG
jgi:hypothetical protein